MSQYLISDLCFYSLLHFLFPYFAKKVKQTIASEKKIGNYSSSGALEQSGRETNNESPFQVTLMLDSQTNSGGKLSSGDTGIY